MLSRKLVALACTALVWSSAVAGPCKPSSDVSSETSLITTTTTEETTTTTTEAVTSTTSSAAVCDDTNLVQNPSFEDGFTPWTKFGNGQVESSNGDVVAQEGGNYYIIHLAEGSFIALRQQVSGLDVDRSYRLRVHLALGINQDFGPGSCSMFITANQIDQGASIPLTPGPVSQYQAIDRTLTLGSEGAFIRFVITCTGIVPAVDALIDDVSLTAICS